MFLTPGKECDDDDDDDDDDGNNLRFSPRTDLVT